ncbi:MAG: dipeptidase [Bacteroidota bacterium]
MPETKQFIEQNKEDFLKELSDFLSIPSVSTAPEHVGDVAKCAEWVSDNLQAIGLKNVEIFKTAGHPIVYGEWLEAGENAPTVLFYGHYDVQPTDPIELWTNPPFEPTIRDGKIFARGAVDDKGQVFLQMKALQSLFKNNAGKLPVNVKLLIEGEEEIGSINLEGFLKEYAEKLKCDTVLVSDTAMYRDGQPSLVYGLRGLCYVEVSVTGPNRDLHSGSFGGTLENPLNALCSIIDSLKDRYGRISVNGFYENVLDLTPQEKEEFAGLNFDEKGYLEELQIPMTYGESGFSTLERVWARPTLDVNGIWGGFTGSGAKTVLPSKAQAKISMRLVPNQTADEIAKKVEAYIKSIAPPTVKVEVEFLHGADPVLTPMDTPGMKAAQRALKKAFGVDSVFTREGGSIPIVLLFDRILKAPTVLMGFGLHSENTHSPDEHFNLHNLFKGIEATAYFYEEMANEKK